ncbi:MAG: hypothetical protein PHN51_12575 [Candidatus Nanopelagicales bacterium]|nr:hypothetical protein [Candidatus Nanopelagicales bacterium]
MATANGEEAGVLTEKAPPDGLMVIDLVVEALAVAPVESIHSINTSTMPAAVPVKSTVALPVLSVVAVVELSVPLPVLEDAIENFKDWPETATAPEFFAEIEIVIGEPAAAAVVVVVAVKVDPVI